MSQLSVQIPDDLHRQAKLQAVESGVTLREVVERLLRAYVSAKITIKPREPDA